MRVSANIATLKARLSEYLRQVKAGNEVVVTERGVPVARLTGLEPSERRATPSRPPRAGRGAEAGARDPSTDIAHPSVW